MIINFINFFPLPLLIALIFSLSAKPAEASTLQFSTDSQKIQLGDTFQVNVKLNTQNEAVNALATNISYPSDKLEVISISTANTFPILAEQIVDGNSIKLAQGSVDPVNGVFSVATVTFKAKGLGNANLSFAE